MNDDKLQMIWSRSRQEEPTMNRMTINQMLDKSARSGWYGMRIEAWAFLIMQGIAELGHIVNLMTSAMAGNVGWLFLHLSLTLLTSGFIAVSVMVLHEVRSFDDGNVNLSELVRRQLRFFHTKYEWWIWTCSLTVWVFSFSLVVLVENQDGTYRAGNIMEVTALSLGMILGTYSLLRAGLYPMVRRSLATLYDLESQTMDETRNVESLRKYWLLGTILLVIALATVVAWTGYLWLSNG